MANDLFSLKICDVMTAAESISQVTNRAGDATNQALDQMDSLSNGGWDGKSKESFESTKTRFKTRNKKLLENLATISHTLSNDKTGVNLFGLDIGSGFDIEEELRDSDTTALSFATLFSASLGSVQDTDEIYLDRGAISSYEEQNSTLQTSLTDIMEAIGNLPTLNLKTQKCDFSLQLQTITATLQLNHSQLSSLKYLIQTYEQNIQWIGEQGTQSFGRIQDDSVTLSEMSSADIRNFFISSMSETLLMKIYSSLSESELESRLNSLSNQELANKLRTIYQYEKQNPLYVDQVNTFLNPLEIEDRVNIKYLIYIADEPYRTLCMKYMDQFKITSVTESGVFVSSNNTLTFDIAADRNDSRGAYAVFFHEMGHAIDYYYGKENGYGGFITDSFKYNGKTIADLNFEDAKNALSTEIQEELKKEHYNKLSEEEKENIKNNIINNVFNRNESFNSLTNLEQTIQINAVNQVNSNLKTADNNGASDVYGGLTGNTMVGDYSHGESYWYEDGKVNRLTNKECFANYFASHIVSEPNQTHRKEGYITNLPESSIGMDNIFIEMEENL